jgi:arylsulfatase A-like enzyme
MLNPRECTAENSAQTIHSGNYNIIMIWIDALRADHLGCYGYHKNTSPNIDALAKQSTIFKNNFASNTVTITSFMSIISSLYPDSHGVYYVGKDKLSSKIKPLAEILHLYGYSTTWLGPKGCAHLDPAIGFGRGFDSVGIFSENLSEGLKTVFEALHKNKSRKFFINFHTYKVHDPYMPSEQYRKVFVNQRRPEAIETPELLAKATYEKIKNELPKKNSDTRTVLGEALSSELIASGLLDGSYNRQRMNTLREYMIRNNQIYKMHHLCAETYIDKIDYSDKKLMAHFSALCDADILEFDTEVIGPLLKKLKELDLYNNSIIIICADHGDEFGEHGYMGHGQTLYDEVTHVPLIIKIPGIQEGRKVTELSETVDIMPTLLDLLKIPIPYYAQGKSLVPYIVQQDTKPLHQFVFGQLGGDDYGHFMIRSKEWKLLLHHNNRKELFNIRKDPAEKRNLYWLRRGVARRLDRELQAWRSSLPSYKVDSLFMPNIDKAAQERIKKTGYW